MAGGAMPIVGQIVGGLLNSPQGTGGGSDSSGGYVQTGGFKFMGATGDPAGTIYNLIRYKKSEKYQKEQDKIKNALLTAQTEQMNIQNKMFKDEQLRQRKIRNLTFYGK